MCSHVAATLYIVVEVGHTLHPAAAAAAVFDYISIVSAHTHMLPSPGYTTNSHAGLRCKHQTIPKPPFPRWVSAVLVPQFETVMRKTYVKRPACDHHTGSECCTISTCIWKIMYYTKTYTTSPCSSRAKERVYLAPLKASMKTY